MFHCALKMKDLCISYAFGPFFLLMPARLLLLGVERERGLGRGIEGEGEGGKERGRGREMV